MPIPIDGHNRRRDTERKQDFISVIAIGLGIASSRDGSRLVPTRELNHGFSGKDATQAE